jgi:hypothetical protein
MTFTLEMDWDAAANPMDDPPGLYPGAVLTDLSLYLDEAATAQGPFWDMPKALILGTPMNAMVDALIHLTVNGANKGPFGRPTGDFTPSLPATV